MIEYGCDSNGEVTGDVDVGGLVRSLDESTGNALNFSTGYAFFDLALNVSLNVGWSRNGTASPFILFPVGVSDLGGASGAVQILKWLKRR